MAWYRRDDKEDELGNEKRSVPAGVFTKCPGCRAALLTADLEKSDQVCPQCDHHFMLSASQRLALVLDPDSFAEEDATIDSIDPLGFRDTKRYVERLRAAKKSSDVPGGDAVRSGAGLIEGQPVEVGVFVFEFMGGSMGSVVGEKITRVYERALERRVPAIVFSSSGGARMQEGVLSLMQMAKTSAALGRLREAGLPYISVLLHPTTGGVAASFAMLGDVIIAEPKALIGFAGARVIQNTIRQRLPPGFQRAEFLLEHGFLDRIVPRRELRATLARLVRLLGPRGR
ncbi:MAG TPA: acetyl-CoA carboxylase, carboxyltransferase subunit beta [Polyangia bacterium]|jgi:acetyl-CoA carboxylase carboxyl transferase subunit beta|nr:acetyl-CoA carboxylase, carboxyltransferase subunit beta [Polyangia bacterium]